MARVLHLRCDRPNVMVKIPATRAGLTAIRHMIGEGKHINVILIFWVDRYAEVAEVGIFNDNRRIARYRARGCMQLVPNEGDCTDSETGRELERELDEWPRSEISRLL